MGGPRRYGMKNGGKMTKQRTTPTAKRNHGFTLMEMLIVVAIIAVLVAVAIPTFSSQLHKARVAADWANVRSYYAQLQYKFMETGEVKSEYLHDLGQPGLPSFQLSGQKITFKAGSIWVRQNDSVGSVDKTGYNILYLCNEHHLNCQLVLPMD